MKIAQKLKNYALEAQVQLNLGVLLLSRGQHAEAEACARRAAALAASSQRPNLAAKAKKNLAESALALGNREKASTDVADLMEEARKLDPSRDKVLLLLGAAELYQKLAANHWERADATRKKALQADSEALRVAESLGDLQGVSASLGHQGTLYEYEGRHAEALQLLRKALSVAQRCQAPDLTYRWQWQCGRVLAKQGFPDEAIQMHRLAVYTLQSIRNDIAIRHGNSNFILSFREVVGTLFLDLADLLLKKSAKATEENDPKLAQALLHEARDTTEMLKSAELEDYFQDDCVHLFQSKRRNIEEISKTAAIVYFIPLPDRTEILLSLPSKGMLQFNSPITDRELRQTAEAFRSGLEDRSTNEYLEPAEHLYRALLEPLEPTLKDSQCDTLVFVPDGPLRTVPMAALFDGKNFLIEKFGIAVVPGLGLMEGLGTRQHGGRVMLGGLSEAVAPFAPLPNVIKEITALAALYPGSEPMVNGSFLRKSVSDKIQNEEFSVVHLASHGHFDRDIRKSFVLTHDATLSLDDLERAIRPAQLREHPLDILALSACQTAAGDDRAALGLAGVAVKAGARSAFATLWFVNDQASTDLVVEFYRHLSQSPVRNKALALRAAQCSLLRQERYRHPCYWAPYLIIGNWM